jgi:hypothetical protein
MQYTINKKPFCGCAFNIKITLSSSFQITVLKNLLWPVILSLNIIGLFLFIKLQYAVLQPMCI